MCLRNTKLQQHTLTWPPKISQPYPNRITDRYWQVLAVQYKSFMVNNRRRVSCWPSPNTAHAPNHSANFRLNTPSSSRCPSKNTSSAHGVPTPPHRVFPSSYAKLQNVPIPSLTSSIICFYEIATGVWLDAPQSPRLSSREVSACHDKRNTKK